MNLAQTILHLYPHGDPTVDFIIEDNSDGNGPYIAYWGLDVPQPNAVELQAAWIDLQANPPKPEKTMDDFMLDLDLRMSKKELGL